MSSKFYKVVAGLNEVGRTFIIHIDSFETSKDISTHIQDLLSGWYIYSIQEIQYRNLEIINYWDRG